MPDGTVPGPRRQVEVAGLAEPQVDAEESRAFTRHRPPSSAIVYYSRRDGDRPGDLVPDGGVPGILDLQGQRVAPQAERGR
jgi:hypothetical protein